MTKFDKTPAKQINQTKLTGRAGIRKGVRAVETKTIIQWVNYKPVFKIEWVAVDDATVYYEVELFSCWVGCVTPTQPTTKAWQTTTIPAKAEECRGADRSQIWDIPVGTKYILIITGEAASPHFLGVVYPNKAYGPSAVKR